MDENLSGAFDHEEQQERMYYKEVYECPYCGKIRDDLMLCCGEIHSEKRIENERA